VSTNGVVDICNTTRERTRRNRKIFRRTHARALTTYFYAIYEYRFTTISRCLFSSFPVPPPAIFEPLFRRNPTTGSQTPSRLARTTHWWPSNRWPGTLRGLTTRTPKRDFLHPGNDRTITGRLRRFRPFVITYEPAGRWHALPRYATVDAKGRGMVFAT